MSDGHTRRKLWHEGYKATIPIYYRNSEYLKMTKYYLSSQPNIKHSCSKLLKKPDEEIDWLVFLLSHGWKQTLSDPNQLTDLKNENTLLTVAKLDDPTKSFSFPKSVAVLKNGLIIICDSGNNRIISFNSGGVQTFLFEKYNIKGESSQLKFPLSVCDFAGVYIAVADYGNSVIPILSHQGTNKMIFVCQSKPISLSSSDSILYVLTELQTIESFSKSGKRIKIFELEKDKKHFFTMISCSKENKEIYLGEVQSNEIYVIDCEGTMLRKMRLNIPDSGINVFLSSIYIVKDNMLVSDSMNRCVYRFNSLNGDFIEIMLNGKSGLGCVQAVAYSRENQLITTEYSLNQPHSVKIFSCHLKCFSNGKLFLE